MLHLLLVSAVPENIISNVGVLRDPLPSEFEIAESIFSVIRRP
jgi:hypothetical protein